MYHLCALLKLISRIYLNSQVNLCLCSRFVTRFTRLSILWATVGKGTYIFSKASILIMGKEVEILHDAQVVSSVECSKHINQPDLFSLNT